MDDQSKQQHLKRTRKRSDSFLWQKVLHSLRTVSWRNDSHPTCVVKQTGWQDQNLPTNHKSCEIKRTHIELFVNNPPYKDQWQKANQSGEVIKIITQTYKMIKQRCNRVFCRILKSKNICIQARIQEFLSGDPFSTHQTSTQDPPSDKYQGVKSRSLWMRASYRFAVWLI